MSLWKINPLRLASMCLAIVGRTTQNRPLVRSCRANVGSTTLMYQCWVIVGSKSGHQHWRATNSSNLYQTIDFCLWWEHPCVCLLVFCLFVCLFVCLGFFVQLKNFSLIWRCHHWQRRASNFEQCSAFMAIEQWGFLSVPHLVWHRPYFYNDHIRGPATDTPIAERLAVELSLPVFTT